MCSTFLLRARQALDTLGIPLGHSIAGTPGTGHLGNVSPGTGHPGSQVKPPKAAQALRGVPTWLAGGEIPLALSEPSRVIGKPQSLMDGAEELCAPASGAGFPQAGAGEPWHT